MCLPERSDRQCFATCAAWRTEQSSGTLQSRAAGRCKAKLEQSRGHHAAAHVAKRQMERSVGWSEATDGANRQMVRQREGSIMVMTIDKEGEDIASK